MLDYLCGHWSEGIIGDGLELGEAATLVASVYDIASARLRAGAAAAPPLHGAPCFDSIGWTMDLLLETLQTCHDEEEAEHCQCWDSDLLDLAGAQLRFLRTVRALGLQHQELEQLDEAGQQGQGGPMLLSWLHKAATATNRAALWRLLGSSESAEVHAAAAQLLHFARGEPGAAVEAAAEEPAQEQAAMSSQSACALSSLAFLMHSSAEQLDQAAGQAAGAVCAAAAAGRQQQQEGGEEEARDTCVAAAGCLQQLGAQGSGQLRTGLLENCWVAPALAMMLRLQREPQVQRAALALLQALATASSPRLTRLLVLRAAGGDARGGGGVAGALVALLELRRQQLLELGDGGDAAQAGGSTAETAADGAAADAVAALRLLRLLVAGSCEAQLLVARLPGAAPALMGLLGCGRSEVADEAAELLGVLQRDSAEARALLLAAGAGVGIGGFGPL
jgi:hypothetical protein